jgi:tetratricopeptide (TPR) repeat protein
LLPTPLFEPASKGAAPPLFDHEFLAKALGALEGAGELEREGERLRLPDAIRERVRAKLDYRASVEATDQALALVLAAFPGDPGDFGNWKRARALMPSLRAAVGRARELEFESPKVSLALALGSESMTASGDFGLANELAEEAFLSAPSSLEPEIRATMNRARGVILSELGELDAARGALEQAHAFRIQAAGAGTAALRADTMALGEVLGELGEFEAARQRLEELRTAAEVPLDRFDAQARRGLAWLLMEQGEFELSEGAYREALAATRRLFAVDHPDTALAHGELGALLLEVSRWEEARSELDLALESACALLGDSHPAVGVIASNLGGALEGLERFEEARQAVERSLAIGHAVLPDGHRNLWLRHRKLARILRALDDYEAAREHAEAAASISERALPAEDPEAARDQLVLAALLQRMGEPVSARKRYESALPILEAGEDRRSPEVVGHQLTFGVLLVELGDLVAARPPLENALAGSAAADGNARVSARIALLGLAERLANELAATLELQGRDEEAGRVREGDRESREAVLKAILAERRIDSSLLAAQAAGAAMPNLASAAVAQARTLAEAAEDEVEREQGLQAVRLTWSSLGLDAFRSRDFEASRRFYETSLELATGDPAAEGEALNDLADIASAEGDDDRAVGIYREALARMRLAGGDGIGYTLLLLGRAHRRLAQYEEAEACFVERLEILRRSDDLSPQTEGVAVHDLADVRRARGEAEEAVELYREAAELKRETGYREDLATTLGALGGALREAGRLAEAADVYAECVRLFRELPDADPGSEAVALQEYAGLLQASSDFKAAEALYRRAIALVSVERDPRFFAYLHFGLAGVLRRLGDQAGAEAALRVRLDLLAELDEEVGWQEGTTLVDLGRLREERGDLAGAIALYRDAAAKLAPAGVPQAYGVALQRLGGALAENQELDEAAASYEEAFEVWAAGGELVSASRVLLDLGRVRYELDDFETAAAVFEKRLNLLRQAAEPNPRAEGFTLHDLADVRRSEKRLPEAIALYREAVERKREGEGSVDLASSLVLLAMTLLEAGEGKEAPALAEEAVAVLRAEPAPDRALLGSAIALVTGLGGGEGAQLPGFEEARDLFEEDPDRSLTDLAGVKTAIATMAGLEGEAGAVAKAEAVEAVAAALADPEVSADPEDVHLLVELAMRVGDRESITTGVERLRALALEGATAGARSQLIELLQVLGRKAAADGDLEDAEAHFRERLSLLAEQSDGGPNPEGITKHDLAHVLGRAGQIGEAIALYREAAELKLRAGNELGVARTLFALAAELRKEGDGEALEIAARSVELFRKQPNADPVELSAALGLLALLEDDGAHALARLAEAKQEVEAMPADEAQVDSARQWIARAEEMIRVRPGRSG